MSQVCCCLKRDVIDEDLEDPMLVEQPRLVAREATLRQKAQEQSRRLNAIEGSMRESDRQMQMMTNRALNSFRTVRRN